MVKKKYTNKASHHETIIRYHETYNWISKTDYTTTYDWILNNLLSDIENRYYETKVFTNLKIAAAKCDKSR